MESRLVGFFASAFLRAADLLGRLDPLEAGPQAGEPAPPPLRDSSCDTLLPTGHHERGEGHIKNRFLSALGMTGLVALQKIDYWKIEWVPDVAGYARQRCGGRQCSADQIVD